MITIRSGTYYKSGRKKSGIQFHVRADRRGANKSMAIHTQPHLLNLDEQAPFSAEAVFSACLQHESEIVPNVKVGNRSAMIL